MAENMTVVAVDGTVTTFKAPNSFDGGAFFAGVFVTVAVLLVTRFVKRRRAGLEARIAAKLDGHRDTARFGEDYAALAQRTATLERIVTEPATRLDREIEALR